VVRQVAKVDIEDAVSERGRLAVGSGVGATVGVTVGAGVGAAVGAEVGVTDGGGDADAPWASAPVASVAMVAKSTTAAAIGVTVRMVEWRMVLESFSTTSGQEAAVMSCTGSMERRRDAHHERRGWASQGGHPSIRAWADVAGIVMAVRRTT
jgi:hypothetical protein